MHLIRLLRTQKHLVPRFRELRYKTGQRLYVELSSQYLWNECRVIVYSSERGMREILLFPH